MKNKFKIIVDILFKNKTYVEKPTTPVVIEKECKVNSLLGRVIVNDENSIPDEIAFKNAVNEIFKGNLIMDFVSKRKIPFMNSDTFLRNEKKTVYEVELFLIKKI